MTRPAARGRQRGRAALAALLLVVLVGVTGGTGSGAAQPAPAPLTLGESLRLALEHSPRLGTTRSQLRERMAKLQEAESVLRPRLDLSGEVSRRNSVSFRGLFPGGRGATEGTAPPQGPPSGGGPLLSGSVTATVPTLSLNYSQVLLRTGDVRLELERAGLGPRLARLAVEQEEAALLAQVEDAYLGVLEAQSALALSRLLARNAREAARVTAGRVEAGTATEVDRLAAETAARQAEQGVAVAEGALELAYRALYRVMGVSLPARRPALEAVAPPEARAFPFTVDLEQLQQQAMAQRPDVARARLAMEDARLALELARREDRPTLALQGTYQWNHPAQSLTLGVDDRSTLQLQASWSDLPEELRFSRGQDTWQVGLQVTWNLADGGANRARVEAARAALEQSRLELAELEAGVAVELARRYAELTEALQELAVAERRVAEAGERHRLLQEQERLGTATRLQVWEAEAEAARARHQRLQAEARVARARTALAVAAGVAPDRLLELLAGAAAGGGKG